MPTCCHPLYKINDVVNKKEKLGLKFYRFPKNSNRKLIRLYYCNYYNCIAPYCMYGTTQTRSWATTCLDENTYSDMCELESYPWKFWLVMLWFSCYRELVVKFTNSTFFKIFIQKKFENGILPDLIKRCLSSNYREFGFQLKTCSSLQSHRCISS